MTGIPKYILAILTALLSGTLNLSAQGPVFQVKQISVNSRLFSEIAPVIVKNGILFCSDKKTSSITDRTTFNNERLYNIYFAERIDTSDWKRPEKLTSDSSQVVFFGPLSIANDGRTVYFTSSFLSGSQARKRNVFNPNGIFTGQLSGTNIIKVRPFRYNNPNYNVRQPSVSRDGKYLYFVSDMPGGKGGWDIYYCEFINGDWNTPVNLGNKVNSTAAEIFPYIHPSGRLYFASNRPGGFGGYDIYYTSLSYGKWDDPVHLPADINSPGNDFALVANEGLQTGYFSSNRSGVSEDIYSFSSAIMRKAKCDSLQLNNYTYTFVEVNAIRFNADTLRSKIPFRYTWNFGDGTQSDGDSTIHTYSGPGNYTVRLDVINTTTGEIKKNEKSYELEIRDIEQPYISAPEVSTAGAQITLSANSTNLPGWNITQYYWNFGDESVSTGPNVNKTFSKPGIYNVQLIVTGTPDGNGPKREACVFKNITVNR
jgi:PKD repeat protein